MGQDNKPKPGAKPAADNQEGDQQTTTPLQPAVVEQSSLPAQQAPAPDEIVLRAGEVLLIALDPGGNEVGPPFRITEKGYQKHYSDETKFRVKKKAQ